jgi:hypothetical protein
VLTPPEREEFVRERLRQHFPEKPKAAVPAVMAQLLAVPQELKAWRAAQPDELPAWAGEAGTGELTALLQPSPGLLAAEPLWRTALAVPTYHQAAKGLQPAARECAEWVRCRFRARDPHREKTHLSVGNTAG